MEQKYTASQYAQMAGGHSLEETKKPAFGFVRDLNESKMYRTRQQYETSDRQDMADFAYVNLLTLLLLSQFEQTEQAARSYASRTASFRNFDTFRQSGTDLYVALAGLKNEYNFDTARIIRFLNSIAQGQNFPGTAAYLMKLERELQISESNYRAIRRIVANISTASVAQRRLAVTRLLQFYRTKAIRGELYAPLKNLAKIGGLEIPGAEVAEKKPSVAAKLATAAAIGTAGFIAGRALGRRIGRG